MLVPWRASGHQGWFYDRRSPLSNVNLGELPVFSAGLAVSSDGFNFLSSMAGKKYTCQCDIHRAWLPLSCASATSSIVDTGFVGAAWQLDVAPLMKVISKLQAGARSDIATGDKQTVSASCWVGVSMPPCKSCCFYACACSRSDPETLLVAVFCVHMSKSIIYFLSSVLCPPHPCTPSEPQGKAQIAWGLLALRPR